MKRIGLTCMAFLLGLPFGMPPILAQTPKDTDASLQLPPVGNRWALVIGVGNYDDKKIEPLAGDRDATIIAKALIRYGGFPPDQVKVLVNGRKNHLYRPTYSSIHYWLDYISQRTSPNDLWLIAFSGHGVHLNASSESPGGDFLLPSDVVASNNAFYLTSRALSVDNLKGYLNRSAVQQAIIFMDSCRTDEDSSKKWNVTDTLSQKTVQSLDFEKANSNLKAAAVFFATSEGQSAYEDHTNKLGFFSEYLVNGFAGGAADAGGTVTLSSLARYLDKEVPSRVHDQLFKEHMDTISKQTPNSHFFGYRANELVVANVKPKTDASGGQSPAVTLAAETIEQFAAVPGPLFSPPRDYSIGGKFPNSVAVGDFNRDGIPDIVTANQQTNDISVLLGNGDGTFQPAVRYPAGSDPYTIVVGYFKGDDKLDVAVANIGYEGLSSISVLLGRGDGTFSEARSYPSNDHPTKLAIADFNGDGKVDLVVGNKLDSAVSVLLGNGDGTFQKPIKYSVGSYPYSVAVGDFNGHKKQDLVVANNVSHSLSILMGKGDGTFAFHEDWPVDTGTWGPYSVQVGDFDRDGNADLVITDYSNSGVGLLLGNGDGTFQGKTAFRTDAGPFDVVIADFDGDGKLDVATANNSNRVSVLLGNGDGTFQSAQSYPGEASPCSIAVGDFNGDGRPDLVTANRGGDSVSVLLNISNSTTVELTSSQNPSVFNSQVTFSAKVSTDSGDAEGFVLFKSDNNMLGKIRLVNGVATVDSYALEPGSHLVSVRFIGSPQFGGSSSSLTQTVTPQ
jgi:hypothetical protein